MLSSPEESEHRRLNHELEGAITASNREQIGAALGLVTQEAFINTVRMVACLRARYLLRCCNCVANVTLNASLQKLLTS